MKKGTTLETTFAQYTVVSPLGAGGAGEVYLVRDDEGAQYALKLLNSQTATTVKRKRFSNEIQFCLRTRHQHVIPVIDHGICVQPDQNATSPFYVMPTYEGSLRSLMDRGLPHDSVLRYFDHLLDGVEAAHLKGVIHRDLKPENVLYDPAHDALVVADFGIAHFSEDELFTLVETRPNDRLANFQYAAPEQKYRGRPIGRATDIYALGLILNEMFTGEVPQGTDHKPIVAVAPDYRYLDDLVNSMIRQDPAARPQSIEDIKKELIGRRQEFVALQKLDAAREQVIPVTDLDDPLINDPIRLVNADYDGATLTLILSQPVHQKWINAFVSMPHHEALWGYGPERYSFKGNKATIAARDDIVQSLINYFKQWLPVAAQQYEMMMRREKQEAERAARERLRAEVEKREKIARVMQNLKI